MGACSKLPGPWGSCPGVDEQQSHTPEARPDWRDWNAERSIHPAMLQPACSASLFPPRHLFSCSHPLLAKNGE